MRKMSALAVSFAVHAALLGLLLLAVHGGRDSFRASPGEAVSVWIEAPEGGQAERRSPFGPVFQEHGRSAKAAPSDARLQDSERGPGPAESFGGAGGGESEDAVGVNRGRGAGGDALLAKIWRRIDASKHYPAAARRRGIAGAPRVTFAISEDGTVEWARIERSSGERMLDEAALATVRRAAPLPYYPAPITLAVKYSMEE